MLNMINSHIEESSFALRLLPNRKAKIDTAKKRPLSGHVMALESSKASGINKAIEPVIKGYPSNMKTRFKVQIILTKVGLRLLSNRSTD